MRSQAFTAAFLAAMVSACGGPLKTGTTVHATDAAAETDPGGCPNDTTVCGAGPFAICADLRNDPEHCGGCDRACPSGIACANGVCQRTACNGQPLLTGKAIKVSEPTLDYSLGARLADVNGDGNLDLVTWRTGRPGVGSFDVSLGQGNGSFAWPQNHPTNLGISDVQVLDVNHDGADDLFIVEFGLSDPNSPSRNTGLGAKCVELWLGGADGNLTPGPEIPVDGCRNVMAFADLSGDGHFDVVASSLQDEGFDVYLSDSAGSLQFSRTYLGASSSPLLVQDWNGDGWLDLISNRSTLQVLLNRGDGIFDEPLDCGLVTGWKIVASDFNHDGHMDLATNLSDVGVDVLLGLGGCRFAPAAHYDLPGNSPLPTTAYCDLLPPADMDGDGHLDLLCRIGKDVFAGLLANPDGTFQVTTSERLVGTAGHDTIVVGDVTGDGHPDLLVADRHGPVGLWENTCP